MIIPPVMKQSEGTPRPKSLAEVPAYVKKISSDFFTRLFYIYGLVWETGPWILFVMLFMSIFSGVMPVVGAYISKNLINSLIDVQTAGFEVVSRLLVMQFLYIFVLRLVNNLDMMMTRAFGEMLVNHIRMKIMRKANELDLSSFDQAIFYEKLENANREAGRRPIQILSSTFQLLSTVISMISFVVILWGVSRWTPVIIILAAIPSAIVNYVYKGRNAAFMRHRSIDRRQMDYYSGLMVDKDMVKEIRLFQLGDLFIKRFADVFDKYFFCLRKLIVSEGIWNIATSMIMTGTSCGLYLWVAWKVYHGELTVGDYTLYTGALNSIGNGVSVLISMTASIFEGTLFINNMISFMNERRSIVPQLQPGRSVDRHTAHTVEFEHVYFRYPGMDHDVLQDINLRFNSGESIVLVGLNGAGKTTLLKLLTRLYDPTQGIVRLDGHDIRDYDVEELYDMYGTIFQDFGRYAETVTQNIAFGQIDKAIDPACVQKAARQANADDFVQQLSRQYQTPLMRIFETDGAELSVGQWQKLAVARAFYNESDILILDEPTASLDALAEQEIFSQFDQLRSGKMTIFVSHRLSSATTASKIIVLQNGQVVEEGTHTQLMAEGGHYYKLFSTQAERYING